jgi:DNA-binding transcriptional LysR family regulator
MALPSAYARPAKPELATGVSARASQEAGGIQALLGLVAAGFGVGLVLGSFRSLRRPGVVYLPLEEPKEIIALAVAWRRGDPSPRLANFLRSVRETTDSPAD